MKGKDQKTGKIAQEAKDMREALKVYADLIIVTNTNMGSGVLEGVVQLGTVSDSCLHLIDLMVVEVSKKAPNDDLVEAYLIMYSIFLSEISYLDDKTSQKQERIDGIEQKLLSLVSLGEIDSLLLSLLVMGLAEANLEFGDALRKVLDESIMAQETGQDIELADLGNPFADMLKECDGDVFLLSNFMLQSAEMMTSEVAEQMFAPMVFAKEEELREAALGCLSSKQDYVRKALLTALFDAASQGHITAVMLRRMITQRNWLPKEERVMIDKVIKACRKNKVECAPWPKAGKIREIWTSGMDGAGAMTLFVVVKEGRRHALATVLLKQNNGIKDVFVSHQMTLPKIKAMLDPAKEQLNLFQSDQAFVITVLQSFLALNIQRKEVLPYPLLDVAETIGIIDLNPADQSVKQLVNELYAEGVKEWGADHISEMVEESDVLLESYGITESWFVEGDAVEAIQQKNIADDKKKILLLNDVMEPKREWWAHQFAWMGMALLHMDLVHGCKKEENCNGWLDFIVIAKEIFDGTALHDIPAMSFIVTQTLEDDLFFF